MTTRRALLLGTLTVGTLDALDAIIFFYLFRATTPMQIFQGIAAGILGRASFSGGLRTMFLGIAIHYFIAFMVVLTFLVVSRRVATLRRWPLASGLIYGIGVWLFMNLIVLPLSVGRPRFLSPVVTNGLLIHMFGVGLPSSLFARAADSDARIHGFRTPGNGSRFAMRD
jgi:4-amino-4-deoxy-L-arabinose transferase-like glycosyltransferase